MKHPKRGISDPMSMMVEDARSYAQWLERRSSREDVARKAGVAPGTIENVRRGRIKDPLRLRGLVDRLRSLMVVELGQEIARLDHEKSLLLATGVDPRSDEMQAVAADIARCRKTLGLEG